MSSLDWCIVGCYMVATISLGLWVSRSNKNARDYLLGGGQMNWIVVGVSMIATSMSASTFLGFPSHSYSNNFAPLLYQIGALVSVLVVTTLFIRHYRQTGIESAYALLELRFSRSVRVLGASLYCMHLLLRSGILIFGPALVLSKATGMGMTPTICIIAVVSMVYTAFGGLKAVVLTDAIQFVVLMLGAVLTLFVLNHHGGLAQLWEVASSAGHTALIPADAGIKEMIDPRAADSLLSAVVVYTVLEIAIRGCDQQFVQRYIACSSTASAVRSSYLSILLGIPAAFIFYSIGALLFGFYSTLPGGVEVMKGNDAYPTFIITYLPSGIRGLLVAALFAASMSSFDSAINALNNTALVDLLGRKGNDPNGLKIARLMSIPWGVLALVAALCAAAAGTGLLYQALYFTSLFTGPLLAMMTMAFYCSHWHSRSVIGGVIIGITGLFLCSPPAFLDWYPPVASWPYNPLISCAGTWLGAALVENIARHFLPTTRPS